MDCANFLLLLLLLFLGRGVPVRQHLWIVFVMVALTHGLNE